MNGRTLAKTNSSITIAQAQSREMRQKLEEERSQKWFENPQNILRDYCDKIMDLLDFIDKFKQLIQIYYKGIEKLLVRLVGHSNTLVPAGTNLSRGLEALRVMYNSERSMPEKIDRTDTRWKELKKMIKRASFNAIEPFQNSDFLEYLDNSIRKNLEKVYNNLIVIGSKYPSLVTSIDHITANLNIRSRVLELPEYNVSNEEMIISRQSDISQSDISYIMDDLLQLCKNTFVQVASVLVSKNGYIQVTSRKTGSARKELEIWPAKNQMNVLENWSKPERKFSFNDGSVPYPSLKPDMCYMTKLDTRASQNPNNERDHIPPFNLYTIISGGPPFDKWLFDSLFKCLSERWGINSVVDSNGLFPRFRDHCFYCTRVIQSFNLQGLCAQLNQVKCSTLLYTLEKQEGVHGDLYYTYELSNRRFQDMYSFIFKASTSGKGKKKGKKRRKKGEKNQRLYI